MNIKYLLVVISAVALLAFTSEAATCSRPADFPAGIDFFLGDYQNWSYENIFKGVWFAYPRTVDDVVIIVNWAHTRQYKVRPVGYANSWSPLTVREGDDICRTIYVNTTTYLTQMELVNKTTDYPYVRVQAGVTLDTLMWFLEGNNLTFQHTPAISIITVGGMLAIGAHGAATNTPLDVPSEQKGLSFGSLSNTVISITAVVWQGSNYGVRYFHRSHTDTKAFLVSLGRAFIVAAELRVGPNFHLRCISYTDIPKWEVFAPTAEGNRSFVKLLQYSGRVGVLLPAFSENPWIRVQIRTPVKPESSQLTTQPYNFPFSEPPNYATVNQTYSTYGFQIAPLASQQTFNNVVAGLNATNTRDIWGWSKNIMFFLKSPSPFHDYALTIVTSYDNLQRVAYETFKKFSEMLTAYAAKGKYPINLSFDTRVSNVDDPADVGVPGAEAAALAATYPVPGKPDWKVVYWINILTVSFTPEKEEFLDEYDEYFYKLYNGSYALARPEWSKSAAYTNKTQSQWTDLHDIDVDIPPRFPLWDWARSKLNSYDPHKVFTSKLVEEIFY